MTDEQQAAAVEEILSGKLQCGCCGELKTFLIKANPQRRLTTRCVQCWKASGYGTITHELENHADRVEIIEPSGLLTVTHDRFKRFHQVDDEDWVQPYDAH